MKKLALFLLLFVTGTVCASAQLLYRISGNGAGKPSYILGTYHLAPAEFVDSIPGAREAFATTEQVCGEVEMQEMLTPEGAQKVMAAMMLPDGKALKDVLSADEVNRLNGYMREILGVDLTNPMIEQQMGKMTPMAISTQLQLVQYMRMTPGFNPASLIDNYFQQEALKAGKPVVGLETLDFQIAVLYKGCSIERQVEQLMCMVDNKEYNLMMMQELTKAYFAKNMAKVLAVTEEKLGNSCDSTPQEDDALIYSRNTDWVGKIPAIIKDKATLFVVGAAHLPGERGVLELLKKAGYTVDAVE